MTTSYLSMSATSRVRPLIVLVLVLIVASAACQSAACGRVDNPDGWSGGVVVDDVIYTGSMDGTLLALEIATGKPIWEFGSLHGDDRRHAFYGDPVVVGDKVYAAGYDGHLYAVSRIDGSAIWEVPVGAEEEPIVGGAGYGDGVVVVGSSDGSVYAFDAEGGTEMWSFATDSMVWTTPLVDEGVVYFGSLDKHVYAVALAGGNEVWKVPVEGAVTAPPAKAGNRIFVGAFDGVFYALDATTGVEEWSFRGATGWYWARPLITGTAVYAASLDGNVYALSPVTGEQIWSEPLETGDRIIGTPAAVDDFLVVASDDGIVWTASLADRGNQRVSKCSIGHRLRTNVVGSDGSIYLGAWDHTVRAFEINGFGVLNTRWIYKTDRSPSENPVFDVSSCGVVWYER